MVGGLFARIHGSLPQSIFSCASIHNRVGTRGQQQRRPQVLGEARCITHMITLLETVSFMIRSLSQLFQRDTQQVYAVAALYTIRFPQREKYKQKEQIQ
jgi:hypothetical protein